MRRRYLVSYDISDAKRLRRVFKKMRGFGDPIHFSVFSCELTKQERVAMIEALSGVFHRAEDRIMVVDLGPARRSPRQSIEFLGRALES
ncbi:MAG: CRISPR-associated endonuclease Cas2, partial [Planctomycetota bacterium]